MATTIVPYNGSLLAVNLLSSAQTILLGQFGTALGGQTVEETKLVVGEIATVGGTPMTVLGAGTAQPGISILSIIVPTGSPVDLVLLQDSFGKIYFMYPNGVPNATGMIALIVDADQTGYNMQSQSMLCLFPETPIPTSRGLVPLADLRPGDSIVTCRDGLQPVLWIATDEIGPETAQGACARPRALRLRRQAEWGAEADLRLTRQHRVAVETVLPGLRHVLIAAAHLTRPEITAVLAHGSDRCRSHLPPVVLPEPLPERTCVHSILLPCHATFVTRGIEVESLLLGPRVLRRTPALAARAPAARTPCLPILTPKQARMLTRSRPCAPSGQHMPDRDRALPGGAVPSANPRPCAMQEGRIPKDTPLQIPGLRPEGALSCSDAAPRPSPP